MDIRKLQRAIVDGLDDVKAQNIVVFNTEALSPLFERVIIASGTSNRQTRALAASVRDAVKALGASPPRTEGEDNGEWIIVDCGAAVVHVMQPAIRDYYRLEEIWGGKPVLLKSQSRVRAGLPKAAEPQAPDEPPAVCSSCHGLRVNPNGTLSVMPLCPNSGVLVLPTTTHPAARKRATSTESAVAGASSTCSAEP